MDGVCDCDCLGLNEERLPPKRLVPCGRGGSDPWPPTDPPGAAAPPITMGLANDFPTAAARMMGDLVEARRTCGEWSRGVTLCGEWAAEAEAEPDPNPEANPPPAADCGVSVGVARSASGRMRKVAADDVDEAEGEDS